ncbi:hypothetical protein Nepgr_016741 [Nepenthes gracilis]|uniref:DUF8204 domain-containing protein n=1 Tax=Nepenthes gracilis TaxID=150966 RepID=A0AAD3SN63_NEPGR|nr:hypothetical protein Nepgr_016741 [Nepenthes gracilis]
MEVGNDNGEEGTIQNQDNQTKGSKGKSCKGTLYYSSILKSKGRNPRCVGLSRTLQQVPSYIVGESEVEASKEGRSLTDFRYACLGYSVYLNDKDVSADGQKPRAELPVCVGLELLVDKRVPAADHTPAHAHSREDDRGFPQPRTQKPTHPIGEEFLSRFTRNASLVASGVARNLRKAGSYIKDSIDDILYPYRRRPNWLDFFFHGEFSKKPLRIEISFSRICKRLQQFGTNSCVKSTKFQELNASNAVADFDKASANRLYSSLSSSLRYSSRYINTKQISKLVNSNGKRLFLVDTLALVRRLEAQGVPSTQAEAITAAITEVLNDSLENVSQSFMSKADMQKIEMIQESNVSKFKSEVQSSQEHHFALLPRETEKLRGDIDKLRSELRYEIDKGTAGQRLDLNLEKGRIRDELANQNAETTNLTNKLDKEIHALRAQLEAAKFDVIKYCMGTIVSISAVGLAMLRIFM